MVQKTLSYYLGDTSHGCLAKQYKKRYAKETTSFSNQLNMFFKKEWWLNKHRYFPLQNFVTPKLGTSIFGHVHSPPTKDSWAPSSATFKKIHTTSSITFKKISNGTHSSWHEFYPPKKLLKDLTIVLTRI